MALSEVTVKNSKYSGKPAGDKLADGGGMYLLVKASGKYWRMDYRFADKRKTSSWRVSGGFVGTGAQAHISGP